MSANAIRLRALARTWGFQPSYRSVEGPTVWAPEATLRYAVAALAQAPVESEADIEKLRQRRKHEVYERGIPPVLVAWEGKLPSFLLTHPGEIESARIGDTKISFEKASLSPRENFPRTRLSANVTLALGYHRLEMRVGGRALQAFVVCAPRAMPLRPEGLPERTWGPFLPFYALRSEKDWGIGGLAEWKIRRELAPFGARWTGSLPLLAGDFEKPDCDPSPYAALTRLFWNEIYLDVDAVLARYPVAAAIEMARSQATALEKAKLRELSHVDYWRVYQLKKRILLAVVKEACTPEWENSAGMRAYLEKNPEARAYAEFRSRDPLEQKYHLFVQSEMTREITALSQDGLGSLYLDYPVGVSEGGFDAHHYKQNFFTAVTVGAPPEALFRLGQNWGFPALHPINIREEEYLYLRRTLESHFRFSKLLRIDHVMGLYRVFVMPKGKNAFDGVYMRHRPEELFAVAMLEAHRAKADIIGEDLGTVPDGVREILDERQIKGMWVLEDQAMQPSMGQPPRASLVCTNTHDMAMWKAFREGSDFALLEKLGICTGAMKDEKQAERKSRLASLPAKLGGDAGIAGAVEWLARSPAEYFVVNLEDLWEETEPQNVPGTWKEYPNWRKKFRFTTREWLGRVKPMLEILKAKRS